MKKTTITVSYDEEKLSALKLYLEQKGLQIEDELAKSLDALFTKTVPAGVREFIGLRSGNVPAPSAHKKKSKSESKPVTPIDEVPSNN